MTTATPPKAAIPDISTAEIVSSVEALAVRAKRALLEGSAAEGARLAQAAKHLIGTIDTEAQSKLSSLESLCRGFVAQADPRAPLSPPAG